jgi:hypothetical protein
MQRNLAFLIIKSKVASSRAVDLSREEDPGVGF